MIERDLVDIATRFGTTAKWIVMIAVCHCALAALTRAAAAAPAAATVLAALATPTPRATPVPATSVPGADALQATITVEGEDRRGSAFLVRMEGKVYLVTNSQVLGGGKIVKFKNLANRELTPGPFQIAADVDLMRAEISGASPVLEMMPKVEQQLKIGDRIAEFGQAQGRDARNELPGVVIGIGPTRIETTAAGMNRDNDDSGGPILLKSSGQVVGVAASEICASSPPGNPAANIRNWRHPATGSAPRDRFGLRLDTVSKWIKPAQPDEIMKERARLSRIQDMTTVLSTMLGIGASFTVQLNPGEFLGDKDIAGDERLAALRKDLDAFTAEYHGAFRLPDHNRLEAAYFDLLKRYVDSDIGDLKAEQFTGYLSVLLGKQLEQRQAMSERLTALAGQTAQRLAAAPRTPAPRPAGPPVDVAKSAVKDLLLVLTDQLDPASPPDKQHRVSYPPETRPSKKENIFWIIKDPNNKYRWVPMRENQLLVETPINGDYRVSVEFWKARPKKKFVEKTVISNYVDFTVTGVHDAPDAPAPAVAVPKATPPAATPAPPVAPHAGPAS